MKQNLAFLFIFCPVLLFARNVGIGNTNPQYPLDISGDINTTGALRANGNAGANGQVLRSNDDGTMAWADMAEYKNMATFRTAGSGNWTVPIAVTKVWIEVWGAGEGGNYYSGGGGSGLRPLIGVLAPGGAAGAEGMVIIHY